MAFDVVDQNVSVLKIVVLCSVVYVSLLLSKLYVRDRAWFVRLHGEIIPSYSERIIDRTGAQTMLYLTCSMISSVDLAHYGVSRAEDWVSVVCGTSCECGISFCFHLYFFLYVTALLSI